MDLKPPRTSGSRDAPLATAKWAESDEIAPLRYEAGSDQFWMGRAPITKDGKPMPIGYADDRHVCLVSGSRGGKGTTVILNNLISWPGSLVCIDPKGENATIAAARRGPGSNYAQGMGQAVHVLDPFRTADVPEEIRGRLNPLDTIDPASDEAIDEAARIADALIVPNDKDPFWSESARALLKGVILHVLSDDAFEGRRNLVTVRKLVTRGDFEAVEQLKAIEHENIPGAHPMLWEALRSSSAYDGVLAGIGETIGSMCEDAPKTYAGVLQTVDRNTEFIDSPAMRACLETSDFEVSDLKTDPKGVSLFLSLPQRYMGTHYRWLRMMVSLVATEMEKTRGQPASGHRVLVCLDEFAGLKRMQVIEEAAAQIAGFGVKLFFCLQSLGQLKEVYKEGWETFLGNAGLKMFFHIEDQFTREYLSRQLGEAELLRKTASEGKGLNMASMGGKGSGGMGLLSLIGDNLNLQSSEGIHKTRLIAPEEIGQIFARIDDPAHDAFPGLGLALVPGKNPIIVKRANYFTEPLFSGRFDPHPDHQVPPTLTERQEAPQAIVGEDKEPIDPALLDNGVGAGLIAFLGITAHRITTVGDAVDHAGLKIIIPIAAVILAAFLYDQLRKHILRLERPMNDNQFFIALAVWLSAFLAIAYSTEFFDALVLSFWSPSP
jgi:type IV secretory pathway TraG/TraD family ATPase VirD4